MDVAVRELDGEEAARAAQTLARKYPVMHGRLVPWLHQLKGVRTVHLEFRER